MILRVCPKCKKAIHIYFNESIVMCHHCGYSLPSKSKRNTYMQSINRRAHKREEIDIDFAFSSGGIQKTAKMTDYSASGGRIVYHGEPVQKDSLVVLDIGRLNIQTEADIVWTKKLSITMNATGLRFRNSMRRSDMKHP